MIKSTKAKNQRRISLTSTSCPYCSSENINKYSSMVHKIRISHPYGNKTLLDLKVQ